MRMAHLLLQMVRTVPICSHCRDGAMAKGRLQPVRSSLPLPLPNTNIVSYSLEMQVQAGPGAENSRTPLLINVTIHNVGKYDRFCPKSI